MAIIVPAYNEEQGLPDTLEALLRQTDAPEQIIVVDDGSADRTAEVARSYAGVTVVQPPANLGSKAKAQNYGLKYATTDLVLPVDADTILADDYVELIKKPFADERVVVAAGCVQTRYTRTAPEKGRQIEYLFGFHWFRPVQNKANSPMVCSGCCSAFRTTSLLEFGGFPERTIVEDMDYTWSQQIAGHRAVYVGDAVAWAADPEDMKYLRKQTWRWMAGYMQNVRIHFWKLARHKKMLWLWVALALLDMIIAPIWWACPVLLVAFFGKSVGGTFMWYFGAELAMTVPPLIYAARRRKLPVWSVLINIPFVYINKAINNYYAWKALIVELILVPMKLSQGLTTYEKGRADDLVPEAA